jgi:hypothetical protein
MPIGYSRAICSIIERVSGMPVEVSCSGVRAIDSGAQFDLLRPRQHGLAAFRW